MRARISEASLASAGPPAVAAALISGAPASNLHGTIYIRIRKANRLIARPQESSVQSEKPPEPYLKGKVTVYLFRITNSPARFDITDSARGKHLAEFKPDP